MTAAATTPYVHVQTQGSVSAADIEYARDKILTALHHARDPVQFVRTRLIVLPDPAIDRPAVVQVNVTVNGRVVRAQVARATVREAVDEVHDRLRDRLQRLAGDWEEIRGGRPTAGEWRHASAPTERPGYVLLPAEQRQIVRHKTFGLRRMSVADAVFDMDMLGYQFHLFTEDSTGCDSVLYRVDDEPGYRLTQLDPETEPALPTGEYVTVSHAHPPTLRVEQAVERLNLTGWPFVFFRDVATRRGCLVYHRYDGHYGLITPAG